MQFTRVKPRETPDPARKALDSRVYVTLSDLVRLQFQATGFSFLPRQPVHSLLSGRKASRMRGRGFDFEEIRAYLPGDDVRSIDWKVTARTREPHVRVFTEERDRPALLVVDQRRAMFFGSRDRMKSVTAAETAALGAWRVLAMGDRVGGLVFDDSETVEVRANRSRATVMALLGEITRKNQALRAKMPLAENPSMLNEALEGASRVVTHDWLVAVISDFDGHDDETDRLISRLASHNDVIAAMVHDPLSSELPESGDLAVSDGELQVELPLGRERVRRNLMDLSKDRQRRVIDWQRRYGVPVVPLSTAEDPGRQLRRLLGFAGQVGRG